MKRNRRRRWELRRIAGRLKRLSRRPIPRMEGEARLRKQLRRQIRSEARHGIDQGVADAFDRVIDSHVIEMRTEIRRHQRAEDTELGELEATLDGLVARYGEDEQRHSDTAERLRHQRWWANRRVEDRDTPMPAGSDPTDDGGHPIGNLGELVGRGVSTRVILWIVLCLAMVADLIAFQEVVRRVANEGFVLPMVIAITATTVYIAHRAGEMLKAAKDGIYRSVSRAVGGWTLVAVWGAMGAGMFVFRLLAPPKASSSNEQNLFADAPQPATDAMPELGALLLLFLYVLTGAVAISAGYQRPRVEVEQVRRADRMLRRARRRLAVRRGEVAEAAGLRQELVNLRTSRQKLYEEEADRCDEAAHRLKAEAAMVIRRRSHAAEPGAPLAP